MANNYRTFFPKLSLLFTGIILSCTIFAQTNYGWIQRAGFPGPARHRGSSAAVGNRGYIGLGHINSVVDILYDDWWEYDPGSDSWAQKASYPGGPRMHAATFVAYNKIYVGTGRDQSSTLRNDFWCYNPATNTWTSIAPFPGAARRGAVAFELNNQGYVGTGSYQSDFFRYDPIGGTWTPVAALPGSGRISSVAFSINGKGYVTTGDFGGPSADMWEYNATFNSWTQKASLPGLPRMEACGFALNGKGFVGTGDNYSSGTNYQDFWCFDPATNSWIQVADFLGQARRYMVSFVIGNRAYAGTGTSGINYADLFEYGSISGIDENSADKLSMEIYPNPANENVLLNFHAEVSNAEIIVSDISGKETRRIKNVSGTNFSFQREDLPAGVYFISLTEENKTKAVSKIIFN